MPVEAITAQLERVVSSSVFVVSPNGPALVVIPFVNLSGDPSQVFFVDGLGEELSVNLARIRFTSIFLTTPPQRRYGHWRQ